MGCGDSKPAETCILSSTLPKFTMPGQNTDNPPQNMQNPYNITNITKASFTNTSITIEYNNKICELNNIDKNDYDCMIMFIGTDGSGQVITMYPLSSEKINQSFTYSFSNKTKKGMYIYGVYGPRSHNTYTWMGLYINDTIEGFTNKITKEEGIAIFLNYINIKSRERFTNPSPSITGYEKSSKYIAKDYHSY